MLHHNIATRAHVGTFVANAMPTMAGCKRPTFPKTVQAGLCSFSGVFKVLISARPKFKHHSLSNHGNQMENVNFWTNAILHTSVDIIELSIIISYLGVLMLTYKYNS